MDFTQNSKKERHLRDLVLWVIGSQNKCVQCVYLDDADDFYFWICEKVFTKKSYVSFIITFELYLTHDYRLFLCKIQWKCTRVHCISIIVYIGKVSRYGSNLAKMLS